jgi:hypothetical protein
MLKLTVWPDSLVGPGEIAVAQGLTFCGPASSKMLWFGPTVKEGASFTAFMVIVKLWGGEVSTPPLAVPPSSWSTSVMVALPKALAAGV